jgi:hypothetical protein
MDGIVACALLVPAYYIATVLERIRLALPRREAVAGIQAV